MTPTKDQQAQEYAEKKTHELILTIGKGPWPRTRELLAKAYLDGYTACEQSQWRSVEDEEPPIGKQHYLMNPQFNSVGGSVDDPCFTLIAKMDKRPPYLVTTETGQLAIEIYADDSPMTVKIKEFMALYNIIDIKMRMLKIQELKLIQGFPEDYVLIGTQADQKKFIGNAVEVTIARAWCEALCSEAKKHLKNRVA